MGALQYKKASEEYVYFPKGNEKIDHYYETHGYVFLYECMGSFGDFLFSDSKTLSQCGKPDNFTSNKRDRKAVGVYIRV